MIGTNTLSLFGVYPREMNVLVACEHSGVVREAFRSLGHNAWSCDLLPAGDQSPFHIQGDAIEAIRKMRWDLVIGHPPCTYLTCSAEWAYGPGPYHQKVKSTTLTGTARAQARQEAIDFFWSMWTTAYEIGAKICLENPVGVINSMQRPDQIIQPHQFGHPESKKTCLWLHRLPNLKPTKILPLPPSGRWENQTPSGQSKIGPSKDRWKKRSKTYQGIAEAMANQWGAL
jgi:hypothetical protein